MKRLKEMPGRLRRAWALLVVSVVNWPLSMFTYAQEEPPVVLSLSWFAIILTCIDIIVTTKVKEDQDAAS